MAPVNMMVKHFSNSFSLKSINMKVMMAEVKVVRMT